MGVRQIPPVLQLQQPCAPLGLTSGSRPMIFMSSTSIAHSSASVCRMAEAMASCCSTVIFVTSLPQGLQKCTKNEQCRVAGAGMPAGMGTRGCLVIQRRERERERERGCIR